MHEAGAVYFLYIVTDTFVTMTEAVAILLTPAAELCILLANLPSMIQQLHTLQQQLHASQDEKNGYSQC